MNRRVAFEEPDGGRGGGAEKTSAGKPSEPSGHDRQGGQAQRGSMNDDSRGTPPEGDFGGAKPDPGIGGGEEKPQGPLEMIQMKKEVHEPELMKGSIDLPKMPEPYTDQSAVAFLEWMYEAGQMVGSLTDRASTWWEAATRVAISAYQAYQMETPLQRLKIRADKNDFVDDPKWARLERRVMALLLQSMQPQIKTEVTMLRIDKVKDCLFLRTSITPEATGNDPWIRQPLGVDFVTAGS